MPWTSARNRWPLRESYGMTVFGQAALAARRLVEAGSKFVTVFWDEFGLAGSGWDTHWDHYPRMKDELLPGPRHGPVRIAHRPGRPRPARRNAGAVPERAWPDAEAATTAKGGGRDHWSRAYSGLMAGGGVARGKVVGHTDKHRRQRRRAADLAQGRTGDHLSSARHRRQHNAHRPHQPPGPGPERRGCDPRGAFLTNRRVEREKGRQDSSPLLLDPSPRFLS